MIILDVVDALVVSLEREVGGRRSEGPDLDGVVEACSRKGVGVLGVDGDGHDVLVTDRSKGRNRERRERRKG